MREEDTAEAGDWVSWGFWSLPVCIQQKVWSICCAPGSGWEERAGVWVIERSEVTVQAWQSYHLLRGDVDTSRPMAQAGCIAVQVLGKEELERSLGHPGLSRGRGCPWMQVWILSLLVPVRGERGQWKRHGLADWSAWPLWAFKRSHVQFFDLGRPGWTQGDGGQAGSQVWPRRGRGTAASTCSSPTARFLAVLNQRLRRPQVPYESLFLFFYLLILKINQFVYFVGEEREREAGGEQQEASTHSWFSYVP